MGMHLPVLVGWEAVRQLKTADAMAGDREKALQAGCRGELRGMVAVKDKGAMDRICFDGLRDGAV